MLTVLTMLLALSANATPVTVELVGFDSNQGSVKLVVFDSDKGWPGDATLAIEKATAPIAKKRASISLDLPEGSHAISVFHDADDDNKLDVKWFVIPSEGVGASNDAKGKMGPPRFDDAVFTVGEAPLTLIITMDYLLR